MKRILVGTDGSESAGVALAWAVSLTKAVDGELVVATVLGPGIAGVPTEDAVAQREQVTELLEGDWCAQARAALPALRTLVLDGDPRVVLRDAVAAERADVLVLGSTGTGWFPAVHLGHVAHAIAHHTEVPLVVVPRTASASLAGPLLVGVDGSAGSAAAAVWTADLARLLGAEVVAVHGHLRFPEPWKTAWQEELEQKCEEWVEPLRDAGVTTRVLTRHGWPAKVLTECETSEQPALVVLGSRGAGGFHELRLGSVALQVLHRARLPVAIVPLTTPK